jgi:hypothetical protein
MLNVIRHSSNEFAFRKGAKMTRKSVVPSFLSVRAQLAFVQRRRAAA